MLIAWLANFLAVRLRLDKAPNFTELLTQADTQVRDLLANQECPFAAVRAALGNRADNLSTFGDPTRAESCWHQISFNAMRPPDFIEEGEFSQLMLDEPGTKVTWSNFTIETLGLRRVPAIRDLSLRPDEVEGQHLANLAFNRAIFSDEEAAQLERRYLALIDAALADPKASLKQVRNRADGICPALDLSAEQPDVVAVGN
jgi:hypothetical protein